MGNLILKTVTLGSLFAFMGVSYAKTEVVCDGLTGVDKIVIASGADINRRVKELEQSGKNVEITQITSSSSASTTSRESISVDKVCAILKY